MSAAETWPTTSIQPARLAFLAIYNPSLGPTDDTFDQQLVFHYSRNAHELRAASKKNARIDAAGGDALREEENEKLRQIGLAQGMVDFARSFSNGQPADSIETEKSRVVLRELEDGWWVLASVSLTRLPSLPTANTPTSKKGTAARDQKASVEYSSREVSPPALLLEQLTQAHRVFCLHHGPSLTENWTRLGRAKFCNILDRFWYRFSRSWDVLLHGNPAVDVLSGVKLSSGGELGFGVGEEEWGSGERDVLEGFPRRTEGLVDVVVSRFGEPAVNVSNQQSPSNAEELPWMGSGREPNASDGVVFGGIGAVDRHSLRDLSLWMRQIYTHGEYAYGVKDNVHRERRKRRRRNPPEPERTSNERGQSRAASQNLSSLGRRPKAQPESRPPGDIQQQIHESSEAAVKSPMPPQRNRTNSTDRTITQSHEPGANVPPPVVSAVEQSLNNATHAADEDLERSNHNTEDDTGAEAEGTTLGISDTYMKYLTFGLSTLNKPAPKKRPPSSRNISTATVKTASSRPSDNANTLLGDEDEDEPPLTQLHPMPDGESVKYRIAHQKRQETEGYFVVGMQGDLRQPPEYDEDSTAGDDESEGSRINLRTIQVKMQLDSSEERADDDFDVDYAQQRPSLARMGSAKSEASRGYHRLRVLIYARRPFVYCFLFETRTASLSYRTFYRTLHENLLPLHKPLLSSTSAAKVAERIETSQMTPPESETASVSSAARLSSKSAPPAPIFDLIYDPRLLTVHASVPNIPEPGTLAAEGIFSSPKEVEAVPGWTRVEAMNVHSLILDTLTSTKKQKTEIERTSKTTRGWWVVWMKVPPSAAPVDPQSHTDLSTETTTTQQTTQAATQDLHRIAFLVRRASDAPTPTTNPNASVVSSRAMSSMLSNMTFGLTGGGRSEDEVTGGASAGWGPAALAGGMGIDARKYVEGLLSLGR